jgi:uncharacterized protein
VIKFTRAHPTLAFFMLTFFLSWMIWVPLALDHFSLLPVRLNEGFVLIVRLFGTLGPAVSAILVSQIYGGRPAVVSLLRQLGKWRVRWTWYVAAGLVFPALVFVVAWIYNQITGSPPLPVQPVSVANLIVILVVMTISVLGEEIGWRGFALPRMQEQFSALKTSLILGTIHTVWHIPFWMILGELERYGWSYWLLSWAWILALTVYITWIMNNTGNSLLLAVLIHWSLNIVTAAYLPITTLVPAYLLLVVIGWSIALGLIGLYGSQRLARPGVRAA